MTTTLSDARDEGFDAYGDGIEFSDCPYEEPDFRYAWQAGWCAAHVRGEASS